MSNDPMPDDHSVGVIGLGVLGTAIVARLRESGFALQVFDPVTAAVQLYLLEGGSDLAATAQTLAEASDIVVVALETADAVRDAALGPSGLIHGRREGGIVIDVSESEPQAAIVLGRRLAGHGIALVDAPVIGGAEEAEAGMLTILASGDGRAIDRAMPVLDALAGRVIRTGPSGSARAAKVLNGLLTAIGLLAATEALLIGKRFGLEPDAALEVVNASTGASHATRTTLPDDVLTRAFSSGHGFARMCRDVEAAISIAREGGTPAPIAALAAEICAAARLNIEAPQDHSDLARWLERIAHAELKRED